MKFTLEEYVAKIELSDSVKWHLEDTKKDFLKYLQALAKLPDDERFFIMN